MSQRTLWKQIAHTYETVSPLSSPYARQASKNRGRSDTSDNEQQWSCTRREKTTHEKSNTGYLRVRPRSPGKMLAASIMKENERKPANAATPTVIATK